MNQPFFYTGIGSRETPKDIMAVMTELARVLASKGWVLRSGGAGGADDAFEAGAPPERRRIYIPWSGFSDRIHGKEGSLDPSKAFSKAIYDQATEIASRHHPGWLNLKPAVRRLMTRNVFQLLGDDLNTPSKFVWCWAPMPKFNADGKIIDVNGGTGLAVRLAATYKVPVYHMGVEDHFRAMRSYMEKIRLEAETNSVSLSSLHRRI